MSNKGNEGQMRKILYIAVPIVVLLIILRFVLFFFKSDGFSGIALIIPLFAAGLIISALVTSLCFAAWVYQDCRIRNDDAILWSVIVFVSTPFIGLLVYFLRRREIRESCPSCGHLVSLEASYCEKCGNQINHKEVHHMNKRTHHLKFIIAGIIGIVVMFTCLIGFIASAVAKENINTSAASDKRVWNTGVISMNYETKLKGVWKLEFKKASDGYVKQAEMKIGDTADTLYADIYCGTVPEGAALTLWMVQGDLAKSVDVTGLSKPLEYPLDEFNSGKIDIRLEISGVENVTSEIYIK